MRTRYKHFLPPSDADTTALWQQATITVDASVLLDLYRFHPTTRDALLTSLESFKGRVWLSHQAAEEFFRNRKKVIADSTKGFEEADKHLDAFAKSLASTAEKLRAERSIPREPVAALVSAIEPHIDLARTALRHAASKHPDYLHADPLLARVLDLFDGCVGPEPTPEKRKQMEKEAERRISQKIPPGYRDGDKPGTASFGDYFLWAQVLEQASSSGGPMLLVTSERKEDWWERLNRRRLGPRHELLAEAATTGQVIAIYEREHFLTEATKRRGLPVQTSVIDEIRALPVWTPRIYGPSTAELDSILESALTELGNEIINSNSLLASCVSRTNASDYYLDELDVISAGPVDLKTVEAPFQARLHFRGEQTSESPYLGDGITAHMSGVVSFDGYAWEIKEYQLTAGLDPPEHDGPDPEPYDDE